MLTKIKFFGLEDLERYAPEGDAVIISVLSRQEELHRPTFVRYRDALILQFDDTTEEHFNALPGSWPATMADEDHAKAVHEPGGRAPEAIDAERIRDFVSQYHASPNKYELVVHCFAGISRSAAIALWASVRHWIPLDTSASTDDANKRLLRLLEAAR